MLHRLLTDTYIYSPDPKLPADEFWGTLCGCVSAKLPPRSIVQNHCQFLRGIGIYYYPYLGFFVCLAHGRLVHPFHLVSHLRNLHDLRETVGKAQLNTKGWDSLRTHIKRTFKVEVDPGPNPPEHLLPEDWTLIEVPVPGLPLVLGFKCSECGWLQGTKDSMKHHYHKKHGKSQKPVSIETAPSPPVGSHSRVLMQICFKGAYKPDLFPAGSSRWYLQVMDLPENQDGFQLRLIETQFSSRSALAATSSVPIPPYIATLGWIDWLQEIHSLQYLVELKWLVSLPSKRKSYGDEVLGKIERGLWETSLLLKRYLGDAENRLESMEPGIRDAVRGR